MASLAQQEQIIRRNETKIARLTEQNAVATAALETMRQLGDALPKSVTPGARMAGSLGSAGMIDLVNSVFPRMSLVHGECAWRPSAVRAYPRQRGIQGCLIARL